MDLFRNGRRGLAYRSRHIAWTISRPVSRELALELLRSRRLEDVYEGTVATLGAVSPSGPLEKALSDILCQRPFAPAISTIAAQSLARGSSRRSLLALEDAFSDSIAVPLADPALAF